MATTRSAPFDADAFRAANNEFLRLTRTPDDIPMEHYRAARDEGMAMRGDALIGILARLPFLLAKRELSREDIAAAVRDVLDDSSKTFNEYLAKLAPMEMTPDSTPEGS